MQHAIALNDQVQLKRLRNSLQAKSRSLLPLRVHNAPKGDRESIIAEEVNIVVTSIYRYEVPLTPAVFSSSLQTLAALFSSCQRKRAEQLHIVPQVFGHVAEIADVSHLPALLGSLLIVAAWEEPHHCHRLTIVLEAILKKLPLQPSSWLPGDYAALADTISIAAQICVSRSLLWETLTSCHLPPKFLSLTHFAVCAGFCNAYKPTTHDHPLAKLFGSFWSFIIPVLQRYSTRYPRLTLCFNHAPPIRILIIAACAGSQATKLIPVTAVNPLLLVFENAISSFFSVHATSNSSSFLVTCLSLFKNMLTRITSVYAALLVRTRATRSAIAIVNDIASRGVGMSSKTIFVRAFVLSLSLELTPEMSAAMLDAISLLETGSSFAPLANQLTKHVARDMKAVNLLAIATYSIMEVDWTHEGRIAQRGYNLTRCTAKVLAVRNRFSHREYCLYDDDSEDSTTSIEDIWVRLTSCLLEIISIEDISRVLDCVAFLVGLFGSSDIVVLQARKHAATNSMCALMKRYMKVISKTSSNNEQERKELVRCMVVVVGGLASSVKDVSLITHCLSKLVHLVSGQGFNVESMTCVCLLRFMQLCDVSLVTIVMTCVDELIGVTAERRNLFREILSVYILRMEMGRKTLCLEWLLNTYNGEQVSSYNGVRNCEVVTASSLQPKL